MISLEHFSYRYAGNDQPALEDLSLTIDEGEFVLLTGPSGCGKTTLALALAGFLFSQYDGEFSGNVDVFGRNPSKEPIYEIADLVGLVQQNPENQFCTLMVEDEIAFGLENRNIPREEIERSLVWALEAVGCLHLRDRSLRSLSGGEKQKIALAAILAANPRMIIFDEPTSNLDPTATREIFEIILDLQRRAKVTVLVIEHKHDFLDRAGPRLIQMSAGRILGQNASRPGPITVRKPEYMNSVDQPLLEVTGLRASYPGRKVLDGLDFQLFPGELVSLLGDNGSGKSTLLLSLLKMHPPESASILFKGRDLKDIEPYELGREIGLVFQNPDHQIFAQTVWQEAVLGPVNYRLQPGEYEDRTRSLLDRAGLGDRLQEHPYRLSYGEKRRLNLISILSYQPQLLLLDEIFIGQDWKNAEFLMGLLVDYVQAGNSVIVVNHNPAYYPLISTRLLFLSGGKLVVDAPLAEGLRRIEEIGKSVYLPGSGS
ncbi:MAG TPA: ABC transporter ATP-binding protein [Chloroflexi bacterium]|nr:ABC transporter ATP-binding protein [Chloroflexota bacterium]